MGRRSRPFVSPPRFSRIQDAEVRRWLVRLRVPDPLMIMAFTVPSSAYASSAACATHAWVRLQHRFLTTLHCAERRLSLLLILNRRRGAFFRLGPFSAFLPPASFILASCLSRLLVVPEPDYYLPAYPSLFAPPLFWRRLLCERLRTLDRPGQTVHPWVSGDPRS